MSGLFESISRRPYVFAFLIAYLFLAVRLLGWRRTILWLVLGYLIAWASEYSSISNGFPYGEYHYVYENLEGELLIAGVPFFDSLSYTFLTFSGYAMALFMLGRKRAFGHSAALLGGLLTMLLDVIVDPIATIGDLWFLGRIHFYAHPGWYFGVPLTNFGGWFLVSFAIVGFNLIAWRAFPRLLKTYDGTTVRRYDSTTVRRYDSTTVRWYDSTPWLYPAFYAGIALFSIVVSFWVGQWRLGLTSSAILAAIMTLAFRGRPSSI